MDFFFCSNQFYSTEAALCQDQGQCTDLYGQSSQQWLLCRLRLSPCHNARAVLLLLHALMYWHISQHASEGGERRWEEGLRMDKIRMLWGMGQKKERERNTRVEMQEMTIWMMMSVSRLDWRTLCRVTEKHKKTSQIRKHKHLFFLLLFLFFLSVFSMRQCYSERVAEAHALFGGGAVNGSELMCSRKRKWVSRTCLTIWFQSIIKYESCLSNMCTNGTCASTVWSKCRGVRPEEHYITHLVRTGI